MEKILHHADRLWVIRVQEYIHAKLPPGLKSYLLISVFLFYVPALISGYIIQYRTGFIIFSINSPQLLLALTWLAFGPYLIRRAYYVVDDFFNNHAGVFTNLNEWATLKESFLRRFVSDSYLYFAIPWSLAVTFVIVATQLYGEKVPVSATIWGSISFLLMFFLSAKGFTGVYLILDMFSSVLTYSLTFNPYHPDKFGGFSNFGRFSVKGAQYFSSGALVFPLVFKIAVMTENNPVFLRVLMVILVIIFLAMLIVCFVQPIIQVKKFVDTQKRLIITDTWEKIEVMLDDYRNSEQADLKKAIELFLVYHIKYNRLWELKDYPYDTKVLTEFSFSFIIPVVVAIIQILIQ